MTSQIQKTFPNILLFIGVSMGFLSALFSCSKKEPASPPSAPRIQSPIDLDTPVENPQLTAALKQLAKSQSPENRKAVWEQLQKANFLVVNFDDEMKVERGPIPGQATIQKGSLLKILEVIDEKDQVLLPLFTDWSEIRAYTNQPASGLVMPSAQAWDFALSNPHYGGGVVINPANQGLRLTREMLQGLTAENSSPK